MRSIIPQFEITAPCARRNSEMKNKVFLSIAAVTAACLSPTFASANVVESIDMQFQSGATFVGDVTFTDNFSAATAVSGTLSGAGYGTDSINWVWSNGTNYSTGANNYSDFLMDGPGSGYVSTGSYNNWIQLSINYADPNQLVFASGVSYGSFDNFVDYVDPMVSGSINGVSAVPEAGTWAMLMLGLGAVGFALRKTRVKSMPTLA
jgi:hypothetical protein